MKTFYTAAAAAALTIGFGATAAQAGETFDTVKERGELVCGVHTGLAGFGAPDQQGNWSGLDVDVCRAVAAGVFGDATKVKYVALSAQQRLTALQAGEVDMLARNTTHTLTRDTANGLNFLPVNYYDGQGFMVRKELGLDSAKQLDGATVCVQTGTTTELNLADYFRANGMQLNPLTIEAFEEVTAAYVSGRCDALTSDASQLAAIRANDLEDPSAHAILPELISKEPLAPAVRHGDDQWYDAVKWIMYAMVDAEEMGITSENIDEIKGSSENPSVKRLLGVTPGMGEALGLPNDWAYNVIKQVGNYGQAYVRNVGTDSPLNLERGLNALWTDGGLMYAPPAR